METLSHLQLGEDSAVMELVHEVFNKRSLGLILCLSTYWLGTLRSTLAFIMCGSRSSLAVPQNFSFGWTTSGEHYASGSPSRASLKISSSMHCSNHCLTC